MRLLLALLAAAAVSVPGLAISHYLVSGRKLPPGQALLALKSVAAYYLPFYFLGAIAFGAFLWWVLVRIGQTSVFAFLLGSLAPVTVVLLIIALLRGGFGGGIQVAFIAFGLPCLLMGFALWALAVRWPLGT